MEALSDPSRGAVRTAAIATLPPPTTTTFLSRLIGVRTFENLLAAEKVFEFPLQRKMLESTDTRTHCDQQVEVTPRRGLPPPGNRSEDPDIARAVPRDDLRDGAPPAAGQLRDGHG